MDWIAFCKHSRLHLVLDYLSPMQFEQRWLAAQRKPAAMHSSFKGQPYNSRKSHRGRIPLFYALFSDMLSEIADDGSAALI